MLLYYVGNEKKCLSRGKSRGANTVLGVFPRARTLCLFEGLLVLGKRFFFLCAKRKEGREYASWTGY